MRTRDHRERVDHDLKAELVQKHGTDKGQSLTPGLFSTRDSAATTAATEDFLQKEFADLDQTRQTAIEQQELDRFLDESTEATEGQENASMNPIALPATSLADVLTQRATRYLVMDTVTIFQFFLLANFGYISMEYFEAD